MPPHALARFPLAVAYACAGTTTIQVRETADAQDHASLEERLRVACERYRLLADLFNLHAEANRSLPEVRLSIDTCVALRRLCLSAAEDLEQLSRELPPGVANWARSRERSPKPR